MSFTNEGVELYSLVVGATPHPIKSKLEKLEQMEFLEHNWKEIGTILE